LWIALAVFVLVTIARGLIHSTGRLEFVGPLTLMRIHVGAAVGAPTAPCNNEIGAPRRVPRSPVLANLFMHYAFDMFLAREFPTVEFERYADDAVVHCVTEPGPASMGGREGVHVLPARSESGGTQGDGSVGP